MKAVIWDMGGVFIRTPVRDGREKWEKLFNLEQGELEHIVFGGHSGYQASIGAITPDQHWAWIYEHLDVPQNQQEEFTADFWSGDIVDYTLIEYIGELQKQYRTGLITNAWLDIRHFLEDVWKVDSVFNEIIISAEVRIAKPDHAIYKMMLARLDVSPEEAVFIDDFVENIEAARALGMHAIQFQTPEQALQELAVLLDEH